MQPFHVKTRVDEAARKLREQFGMAWRVRQIEIVWRIDQSSPEVMRPDAIHKRWREVWIAFLAEPGHQRHTRIGMCQRIDRRAAEQFADVWNILGILRQLLTRSRYENFRPRHFFALTGQFPVRLSPRSRGPQRLGVELPLDRVVSRLRFGRHTFGNSSE